MNWTRQWFRSISISKKLLLSNLMTVVLPLVFLFLFVSSSLISLTSQQFVNSSRQTLDQTAEYLSYKLSGAASITMTAAYDPERYLMISQDPQIYSLPDQLYDAWRLTNFVDSLRVMDPTLRIHMYVNDNLYYANEEVLFHPLSRLTTAVWFRDMIAKGEALIWHKSELLDPGMLPGSAPKALSVVRRIIDLRATDETLAVLRVDTSIADIEAILNRAIMSKGSSVWLINEEGQVLAFSIRQDKNAVPSQANPTQEADPDSKMQPTKEQFLESMKNPSWHKVRIDNNTFLTSSVVVANTPLHIMSVLPQSAPIRQSDKLRLEFLLIILGVMVVVLFVSLKFTRAIASRLRKISERMHWVHKGIMEPIQVDVKDDEIGDLAQTYNFMISRINQLADERYELGREALKHEMSVLQGQINPHFLYNMLDLINLSALDKGMPDLAELVRMLARFYRLGLNQGRDTVTIRDELEHVSLYFKMQNRRFGDRIHFEVEFSDEILPYRMLKIILQPLVENSVLHGILSERDGRGNIFISGNLEAGRIVFTIRDDGVGIQSEKLALLLNKAGSGYGLYNVHRRLCIFYGNDSGLVIKSIQGSGTTVQFSIPTDTTPI